MLKSQSRENQDLALVALYNGKRNGTYLELGGGDPVTDSNSYLLEKEYAWRGITLEMNKNFESAWRTERSNPCLHQDATTLDYSELLAEHNLGTEIDFLQLDIDGTNKGQNNNSLRILESLDLNRLTFGFITFEHNLYLDPETPERLRSREILQDHGYTLLISDVMHNDLVFEDWWIMERMMPDQEWRRLQGERLQMRGAPGGALLELLRARGLYTG